MTKPVPLWWVDVFAEVPLGGNPLVVLDGRDVREEDLLPLARELSLSETAFIYPATEAGADARVRIFTQSKEVPFSGHPTLGAAVALLLSGRLPWQAPSTMVRLELGIGVVPVTITGEQRPERARFAHTRIGVPHSEITDERIAWLPPALGLGREQLGATVEGRALHPQVVSGGALQLMVPVGGPWDVEQIQSSYQDVVTAERALGAELGILAFGFSAAVRRDAPVEVRARFFAHDAPQEDPATGSAAAALAVYLHHHGILRPGQPLEIDQGPPHGITAELPGRRSLLRAFCDGVTVEVEGRVREVLRGELCLSL